MAEVANPKGSITQYSSSSSLGTIQLGAGATNATVLAEIYSLLTYIQQLSLSTQQEQIKNQAAMAVAQGDAAKASLEDQASATRAQGISSMIGGGLQVGVEGYSIAKSSGGFGATNKQIKEQEAVLSEMKTRENALKNTASEPVLAADANALNGGQPVVQNPGSLELRNRFMGEEPIGNIGNGTLTDQHRAEIQSHIADKKRAAEEKLNTLNRAANEENYGRRNVSQALGQLSTGTGQLIAAKYTTDQAEEEQKKAILEASGAMVSSGLQTSQSIQSTAAQEQQSVLQNLDAAQHQIRG